MEQGARTYAEDLLQEYTERIGPVVKSADFATQEWAAATVSYTHLRAHETVLDLVCRLLLEKKK